MFRLAKATRSPLNRRHLTSISTPSEISSILPFVSGVCKLRGNDRLLERCTAQYKPDSEIDISALALRRSLSADHILFPPARNNPEGRVREQSWLRLVYPFGSEPELRDGYRLFNTSRFVGF